MLEGKLSQNIVIFVVVLISNVFNHVLSYCNIAIHCKKDINTVTFSF
jgi:hypothetical protein